MLQCTESLILYVNTNENVKTTFMWYPSLSNSRVSLLEDCNKDVDNDGDSNILLYDFRVCALGGVMID